MLRIALLGGLTVTRSEPGPAVALRTRKTRALLGYLACPAGRAHPRDKLAALLWGDCTDRQAQTNLRQALYGLRKALAPVEPQALRAVEDAVSLEPARVEVDALRFEHLVSEGTPAALAAAVALYQGELLEGLAIEAPAFEEWLLGERERLRERAIEAMARLLTHQRTFLRGGTRDLTPPPHIFAAHRDGTIRKLSLDRIPDLPGDVIGFFGPIPLPPVGNRNRHLRLISSYMDQNFDPGCSWEDQEATDTSQLGDWLLPFAWTEDG